MRLAEYIPIVDGTLRAFSERSGVPISVLDRVVRGESCSLKNGAKIVRATHAKPTPSGGAVTFEELLPQEVAA